MVELRRSDQTNSEISQLPLSLVVVVSAGPVVYVNSSDESVDAIKKQGAREKEDELINPLFPHLLSIAKILADFVSHCSSGAPFRFLRLFESWSPQR